MHTIYFSLGLVLGDNLGLNSILGFVESFSANYYCRVCRSHKSDLQYMLKESKMIRDKTNYIDDLKTNDVSLTGINELCVFNKVPNFHVMDNIVCNFMHDVLEGVARYDTAVIMNHLIGKNFFTLDILNKRIELFNYGITERKNTPPSINQNHLKKVI